MEKVMDEMGLAAQSVQPQGPQGPQIRPEMVAEVIQLIMSGATEAQLIQMGVPEEVIAAAIMQISQEQQAPMDESAGLAAQQGMV